MAEQTSGGRSTLAFILGGVVIAIAMVVWYLAATDNNIFSRSTAPAGSSVTIEMPAAPAAPAPAEPAAPAAPAD